MKAHDPNGKHVPTKMVGNRNWSKRHQGGKHKPKVKK